MFKLNSAAFAAVASVALIASASACKKNETPAADTTAIAPLPPATPAPAALHVTQVETGKGVNTDKSIKDDAHDFGVRDTIWVAVKTEGAGSGTLAAKFTYQGNQKVTETSQSISPTADTWSEFHIDKKTAWPKGKYRLVIHLNGGSVGGKEFFSEVELMG